MHFPALHAFILRRAAHVAGALPIDQLCFRQVGKSKAAPRLDCIHFLKLSELNECQPTPCNLNETFARALRSSCP